MELFGWISSIFLALCGIPQAIKAIKDKHSHGVSWGFIILWFLGEICGLIYVTHLGNLPLIINYFCNVLFTFIIFWFKVFPKN